MGISTAGGTTIDMWNWASLTRYGNQVRKLIIYEVKQYAEYEVKSGLQRSNRDDDPNHKAATIYIKPEVLNIRLSISLRLELHTY